MRTLLLAPLAALVAGSATAQDLCPLFPLDPVSPSVTARHLRGLDVKASLLAAQVTTNDVESVEVRFRNDPAWLAPFVLDSPQSYHSGFGDSIAIEQEFFGPEIMIAAPGAPNTMGGSGSGLVYRYTYTGAGWSQLPEFRSSDPLAQNFATNLARDEGVAVVQSQIHMFASTEAQVHVFEPLGAISWLETSILRHPNPNGPTGTFGSALSVDDNTIVIGARGGPGGGLLGQAWVWERAAPGQVGFRQELTPNQPVSRLFGSQVSISRDRIAVSDPGLIHPQTPAREGAVMIFERIHPNGQFVETMRFYAPSAASSKFGRSIDLERNRLAVTYSIPVGGPFLGGRDAVAVYEGLIGGPVSLRTYEATLGDPAEAVGQVVALGQGEAVTTMTHVMVGNAIRLEPALRRFAVDEPAAQLCVGQPNSTGARGQLSLDGCHSTGELPLRASSLPSFVFGLPVIGRTPATIPVNAGFLCIGDPLRGPIVQSNGAGTARVTMDPSSFGFMPGEILFAQFWHRDSLGGANLTEAIMVELAP